MSTTKERTCLLVLGMHRSGTSVLTRVLNLAGATLPKRLMGASDNSNATGHWEPDILVQYHEGMLAELGSSWHDWKALELSLLPVKRREEIHQEIAEIIETDYGKAELFVLKDPRICRFVPFFQEMLRGLDISPLPILIFRNPLEVMGSLSKRDGLSRSEVALLWLRHVLEAERATRGQKRAFFTYAGLLDDWRGEFMQLVKSFDLGNLHEADEIATLVEEFISADHRHNVYKSEAVRLDPLLSDWVAEVWEAYYILTRDPDSKKAQARLDRVAELFDSASPVLAVNFDEVRREKENAISDLRSVLQQKEAELSTALAEHEQGITSIKELLSDEQGKVAKLENCLSQTEGEASQLEATLAQRGSEIADLKQQLSDNETQSATLKRGQDKAEGRNEELTAALEEQERKAAELTAAITHQRRQTTSVKSALTKQKTKTSRLEEMLFETEGVAEEIKTLLAERDEETVDLKENLASEQAETGKLYEQINATKLEARNMEALFRNSTSWKLTRPIRAIGKTINGIKKKPGEIDQFVRTVRRGVEFSGGLVSTITRARNILNREGIEGLKQRYRYVSGNRTNLRRPAVSVGVVPYDDQEIGEQSNFLTSEIKRDVLEHLQPLETGVPEWAKTNLDTPLTVGEFEERLKIMAPDVCRRLILSVTHDDYSNIIGGVQFCVQLEEREFVDDGYPYLNIHPQYPVPVLSRESDARSYFFKVKVDGEPVGTVAGETLTTVLNNLKMQGARMKCVVHSLLGHSPEILANVIESTGVSNALFWLHDYFTVCPNYNLLRNNITFCNGPAKDSLSCSICVYGEERMEHLRRIELFFNTKVEFEIAAPSQYALDLWSRTSSLRHRKAIVLPHSELVAETSSKLATSPPDKGAVRIAFLGYPVLHKGWPFFVRLADRMAGGGRYKFFLLGQTDPKKSNIDFISVRTSALRPDAMVQAIITNNIDVVLLWPIWPETFSFTLYEGLAAGAWVVTNKVSGNIQAVVSQSNEGIVLADEEQLLEFFDTQKLEEIILERRSHGRKTFATEFSSLSHKLVG